MKHPRCYARAPVTNFRERVREMLSDIESRGLRRHPRSVEGPQDTRLWVDGKHVLCLCSNNYLGLARDPALAAAIRAALHEDGVGAAASRHISGNMRLHREAEAQLAAYVRHEDAVLFSSGYAANVGTVQGLVGRGDVVFSDELNHASIIDGARLSRADIVIYAHGDADDLRRKLREHRQRGRGALVVTETLFSMDGDVPPIAELASLAREFEAGFMVDEAHALGVLGPEGRGVCAELGIQPDVTVGTLGKAFGGQGAFAAADHETVELIRNRARSYIFSTAPSPALTAAAVASVALVEGAEERRRSLRANWTKLRRGLEALEFRVVPGDSPIIPVLTGDPGPTMSLSRALFEHGVFVHGVRPPTVPAGKGRLRIVPMANHSEADIEEALAAFAKVRR